jgi:transposase
MKPVSVESRIDWCDFTRMQTDSRAQAVARRVDYSWALNDSMVQKVVAARIAIIACARKIPDTLEQLRALDALAVDRLSRNKSEHNRMCADAARRVGGLAPYFAALVYRAIRLGEDSTEIAQEMNVTPWGIRATLWRLNQTAQLFAAGTFRLCDTEMRYPRRSGKRGPRPRWDFQSAILLRKDGLSYVEIAAKFGVHEQTVLSAFMKAGLRFPRARRCRPKGHKFPHLQAVELFKQGVNCSEIGRMFGVHPSSVWMCVHNSPIACAAPAKPKPRQKQGRIQQTSRVPRSPRTHAPRTIASGEMVR